MGKSGILRAACLWTAASLWGQPTAVEVFGQAGLARAAGDESWLGRGPSFGGALMAPLRPRLAFDLDIQGTRTKRDDASGLEFRANQALVSPSLVYRRGSRQAYLFAGGGVGAEIVNLEIRAFPGEPGRGRVLRSRESGAMFLGKAGFVAALSRRALLRVDLLVGFRHVLPNLGVRAGVGYRF